jgi:hypothetical protein
MSTVILPISLVLSLIAYAGLANAELSAIEREKLRLCPKNCAAYCEEVPGHPTYCTCFCQAPEPAELTHHRKQR